jgi:hypothetical protein
VDVLTPRTLDEALELKAERPDAVPIAGGTDVMVRSTSTACGPGPCSTSRRSRAARLVARERHGPARRAATYTELMAPDAAAAARLGRGRAHRRLAADPEPRHRRRQPRHRLAGRRRAAAAPRRRGGRSSSQRPRRRALPLADFLVGPKRNALEPDELIVGVTVRRPARETFMKVGPAERDGDRRLLARAPGRPRAATARASFGSAGPATGLVRAPLDEADLPEQVAARPRPIDDVRGTRAYRRHALRVLTRRALERCLA